MGKHRSLVIAIVGVVVMAFAVSVIWAGPTSDSTTGHPWYTGKSCSDLRYMYNSLEEKLMNGGTSAGGPTLGQVEQVARTKNCAWVAQMN